jgi:hypothetical protein
MLASRRTDLLEIGFKSNAQMRGTLLMDRRRVGRMTSLEPAFISLTQGFKPDREPIERLIETVYASAYDAVIPDHYPNFISVHSSDGRVIAAAGFRPAAGQPLFLEAYLPSPVEEMIAARMQVPLARSSIVEIGNLVSIGKGASLFLFVALSAFLHHNRFNYAVATATRSLGRSFAAFGIESIQLGQASPEVLPDRGASWGRYYRRRPRVLAGAIAAACARLEAFLPEQQNIGLEELFAVSIPPEESFQ